jgi:hypothetical protein
VLLNQREAFRERIVPRRGDPISILQRFIPARSAKDGSGTPCTGQIAVPGGRHDAARRPLTDPS